MQAVLRVMAVIFWSTMAIATRSVPPSANVEKGLVNLSHIAANLGLPPPSSFGNVTAASNSAKCIVAGHPARVVDAPVSKKSRSLLGARMQVSTECHQCYSTQGKAASMDQCLNAYYITCNYYGVRAVRSCRCEEHGYEHPYLNPGGAPEGMRGTWKCCFFHECMGNDNWNPPGSRLNPLTTDEYGNKS